jgi:hypothetical protein
MQDHPPQNRAERRAQARKGKPGAALVRPFRPQSQSAAQEPATGTGNRSAASAERQEPLDPYGADNPETGVPPLWTFPGVEPQGERKVSHKAGGSKQQRIRDTLVSYYALAGMAVSRMDMTDGQIVVASAQNCADAWMAAGKANPQIMRALELITIAGPYTALISAHVMVAITIMDRHNANPFAALFAPRTPRTPRQPVTGPSPSGEQATPAPLPYVPVGAMAPTDAAPPPMQYPGDESGLVIIPDEGIPADLDVALRELARSTGRSYDELRQEALVELAQMRMSQNGHIQQPGSLGAPVTRG